MLIATSDINIIKSKRYEAGVYQLRLHKPFFDKHAKVFTDYCVLKPLFTCTGDEKYLFTSMGIGASKFQAISTGMERLRRKLEMSFDEEDVFCFANETNTVQSIDSVVYNLLFNPPDATNCISKVKTIKNKIARVKLNAQKGNESFQLDIILGQPYGADGKWWCRYQIFPNEPKAVCEKDSFRSFRMAYHLLFKWFFENLDNDWIFWHYENGHLRKSEYTQVLQWYFSGCLPD